MLQRVPTILHMAQPAHDHQLQIQPLNLCCVAWLLVRQRQCRKHYRLRNFLTSAFLKLLSMGVWTVHLRYLCGRQWSLHRTAI